MVWEEGYAGGLAVLAIDTRISGRHSRPFEVRSPTGDPSSRVRTTYFSIIILLYVLSGDY